MQLTEEILEELTQCAISAAQEAGAYIQDAAKKSVEVQHKEGGSNLAAQVVTEVDMKADAMISAALQPTCAKYDLALLTEEGDDDLSRLEKPAFWCVDPLDGTLGFINQRPGYSVSIALVANDGTPLIGVVYDPESEVMYAATRGRGAQRQGEAWQPLTTPESDAAFTLVLDRGFNDREDYPQLLKGINKLVMESGYENVQVYAGDGGVINALRVLENAPGCYFKLPKPEEGGGCLWDFAATACIFNECGASATDFLGQPLALNRADTLFMNDNGVLYASSAALADDIRRRLSPA